MTVMIHELRQNRTSFLVWTAAISFLLAVCIFLYPEMKDEMDGMNELFASMGSFTKAFGMDRLNFGTLKGFYAVECGNVLGLGGSLFGSLTAATMLSKEETNRTAEFLLSHPISRTAVAAQKLAALMVLIIAMNVVVFLVSIGCIALIGESSPWHELFLLHGACLLMQMELAAICFAVSAFIKKGSAACGIGIALTLYFLSLIANISDKMEFLKAVTPFGYFDPAAIVSENSVVLPLLATGMLIGLAAIIIAFVRYRKKDIL